MNNSPNQDILLLPAHAQRHPDDAERELRSHIHWSTSWRRKKSLNPPPKAIEALKRVTKAFNGRQLVRRLIAPTSDFESEGQVTDTFTGILVFRDSGSSVLGVAHLDSVSHPHFFGKRWLDSEPYLFATSVDDRVGAYVLLDLLPALGIHVDVLLTEGEETGQSTAAYFDANGKEWNWIFSFDREGTDVVMYQYGNHDLRKLLPEYGFEVDQGSFSDIVWLEGLGVKGFNFGTGYYASHQKAAFVSINDLLWQVAKFTVFYEDQKNTKMGHIAAPRSTSRRAWSNYTGYDWGYESFDDEGHRYDDRSGELTAPNFATQDHPCVCGTVIRGFQKYTTRTCMRCGRKFYWGLDGVRSIGSVDGGPAASKWRCPKCNAILIYWVDMGGMVCYNCKTVWQGVNDSSTSSRLVLVDTLMKCNLCGVNSAFSTMTEVVGGELICRPCFSEFGEECPSCGRPFIKMKSETCCHECITYFLDDG